MDGFGARLAARARELGLTNAEVARKAGLSERRFGNYVTDYREPDLRTLATLARVLLITADALLGLAPDAAAESDRSRLLAQIKISLSRLPEAELELIAVQLRAVAEWRDP
jgi:transcriptional regulator with XRE-family HTH domain